MTKFRDRLLVVAAAASLAGDVACDQHKAVVTSQPSTQETTRDSANLMSLEEAKAALWNAPGWTNMRARSAESVRLVEALNEICRLETPALRKLVASFMEELESREARHLIVDEWSKIFILNRVAFEAPQEFSIKGREGGIFGGWGNVPVENRVVNLRWPVVYASSGRAQIEGEFGGFMGPGYSGLEEFDFFAERFPRRIAHEK